MNLIGLMPARNEAWIIGLSVRVALQWCDSLIVLNHASTDETADILAEAQRETGRLAVIEEPDPTWAEMAHRQRLLNEARKRGATHIGLVDADEIMCAITVPGIRDSISRLAPGRFLLTPMRAMWRSPFRVRTDKQTVFHGARVSVAFADTGIQRWQPDGGYEFHHREPYNSQLGAVTGLSGGVMHLQFADWNRVVAKHALYKMTEVLRWPDRRPAAAVDRQYSRSLDERGMETAPAPAEWWAGYEPWLKYLHVGAEPWQASKARELWQQHGPQRFAGLDLFGVAA